jgi:hypothetical protein
LIRTGRDTVPHGHDRSHDPARPAKQDVPGWANKAITKCPGIEQQGDRDPGARPEKENIMEVVFFIGPLILLTALIYGSLHYHYRDRRKSKVADQIVRTDTSIIEPDWRPEQAP